MTEIVLAYDKSVFTPVEAEVLEAVHPAIGMLKLGLEAITALDPISKRTIAYEVGRHFSRDGSELLLDEKLHDISNTIAAAVRNLAGTVGGATIHASAGPRGLEAAVKAREERIGPRGGLSPDDPTPWMTLFGVTVLTSHDETECVHIFGDKPGPKVLQFARDCASVGIDGLVCSGKELRLLQDAGLADKFVTLVPGGRPEWAATDDQKRVITPTEIAGLRANFAVFGRPVWKGPYPPAKAVQLINQEMAAA